jgi:Flp pilus assembly protein TadG
MQTRAKNVSPRRGLAVVEFAIIAPVFVFLALGMVEMARGMMVKEVLTDAARKGARTGILPYAANAAIQSDVNSVLTSNNISAADATVIIQVNDKTVDAATAVQNDKISVKVSIPVAKVAWITPLFLPGATIESETMVMMRQR